MKQKQVGSYGLKGLFSMVFLFLFFFSGLSVYGETLPPGLLIGDLKGIKINNEGEYFIDLPNIKPGDVYTKELAIRNVDKKEGFDVRLLVEPGKGTGPIDFTKAVNVKLEHKGGDLLYEGGILGTSSYDWTKEQLMLGHFLPGSESTVKATFTVSKDLGLADYKEPSEYKFTWHFIVRSKETTTTSSTTGSSETTTSSTNRPIIRPTDDNQKPTGLFPKTGEEWESLLYKTCAGLFLIIVVLLIYRKRRIDEKNGSRN